MSIPFAAALGIIIVTAFMGLPMGIAMISGSILYLLMRGQDMGIAAEQFLNGMYTNYIMLAVPRFLLALIAALILFTFVPETVLWLPRLFGYTGVSL